MSNTLIFNLPDVGEGLVEADIVSWKVKPGDSVAINDVIVEIETAKSLVELPSPYAGVVAELLAQEGQTIEVGAPIIAVRTAGAEPQDGPAKPGGDALAEALPAPGAGTAAPEPETKPLVGSGPKADAVKRRPRRSAGAARATTTTAGGQGEGNA
ncbi:branched-chain alpha-keto acid dehydrogenase subunit E2, partial [Arthrobacter crystallopoietes BAB-32]